MDDCRRHIIRRELPGFHDICEFFQQIQLILEQLAISQGDLLRLPHNELLHFNVQRVAHLAVQKCTDPKKNQQKNEELPDHAHGKAQRAPLRGVLRLI